MSNKNLTERIIFPATKEMVEEIDRIADEQDVSRAHFIRGCVKERIKNYKFEV